MLVYGDGERRERTAEKMARLRAGLAPPGMPGTLERHSRIASLFVEAGELAQGLLDEQLARLGEERWTPLSDLCVRLTLSLAEALQCSFRGEPLPWPNQAAAGSCVTERHPPPVLPPSPPTTPPRGEEPFALGSPNQESGKTASRASLPPGRGRGGDGGRTGGGWNREDLAYRVLPRSLLDRLAALDLPEAITVHVPEGYVHYGLYPETYLRAATALRGEPGPLIVIGIRSIGTSLAAAVAAGAGGADHLASVRPGGHPFARQIDLGEDLARRLLDPPGARYAVVDEGPGLSGSSFGCVADWLEDRGVPPESIVFFPSHQGDLGPRGSDRHRGRWSRARRLTAEFDDLFLAPDTPLSLVLGAPYEDLSGGRWRERLLGEEALWPAVHLQQERRKLLVEARGHRWLLKFEGIGRYGEEAFERAEALAQAGLAPPVAGLRHGFLVGPWLEGARPLPVAPWVDRAALLDQVARHLAFLAERYPAPSAPGASPGKLLDMATFNTEQALGGEAAAELSAWRERLPGLIERSRPAATDNRMHAWEWLILPDGQILKSDALDHHRGNDLVGAQDPAWDVAGAAVELALTPEEREELREHLARRGATRVTSHELLFYEAAYLAFQLGHHTLAATALQSVSPAEATRLRSAAGLYGARLRILLTAPSGRETAGPPRASSQSHP